VADSITTRYGSDLASRLNQLQTAQAEVQRQYLQALDQALAHPGPQQPGSLFAPDSDTTGLPEALRQLPQRPGQHQGQQGSWALDPVAFSQHWAQGDSPLQKAYASLHGSDGLQRITSAAGQESQTTHWMLAGQKLQPLQLAAGDSPGQASRLIDGWERIDPSRPEKLINNDLVWFDPQRGWVTDPKNLKGNWLDQNFPQLMGIGFAAVGAGLASQLVAEFTGSAVAQGVAMGATSSTLNQFVSTGHVNFKSVLQSALAGGLTAGISNLPGVGQHIDGVAGTFGERLMEYTGRASLQGAIQSVVGGKFKDGFVNSLMGSVAGEVSGQLNAEIAQMSEAGTLSDSQASTLRLLARATSSALRVVANPGDPAAGLAGDFLSGILGDAVQGEFDRAGPGASAAGADSTDSTADTDSAAPTSQEPGQAAPATVTVAAGDTLERLARQIYGEQWRAGLTALVADNPGIATNRWGSPIIQPGQTLNTPSLDGLSPDQLSRLGQLGGQIVANNTQGLNVRAELLAAREAQRAAQQAAAQSGNPSTMSQDEAYARYMAAGGRSGGYANAMGEDYKPVWHQGQNGPLAVSADPQTRLGQLMAVSNADSSAGYSAAELSAMAKEYRAMFPGRDSIYNGLWAKAVQARMIEAGALQRVDLEDIAKFGNDYGLHAEAGMPLGGAIGALARRAGTRSVDIASPTKGVEHVATFSSVNAARSFAQEMSGLGDDAVDYIQKIGPMKGLVTGRASSDGSRGWRLDFDNEKLFHINWWDNTGGSKRADRLYGASKIEGGTLDQYRELLHHFPKK
jgi:LysM repeat protein